MPDLCGIVKNGIWYCEEDNCYYKNYKIMYDGEIYNSVEIKLELIDKGYIFSTYLEEEVVLKAYIEWGTECLNKFSGIFFISIWDIEKKTLFIARDFIGVKPVYYAQIADGIIVSNRISKIFEKTEIKANSTYDKIFDLFVFGNMNIKGNTVFNNIKIIMPGEFLYYDQKMKVDCYDKTNISSEKNIKPLNINQEVITNIRNIISESVIRQIIPDTEIFTELFGSNINAFIIALISDILKIYNKKLTTISINDTNNVKKIIEKFETENFSFLSKFEINDIYKILKLKEFPDDYDSYTYYLMLKQMKNYKDIYITGAYAEYIFSNIKKVSFNQKLALLNEDFIKNINKEFLIEDFYCRKIEKKYKYNYVISRILESREKIASYFNMSIRNPIYSKELLEYIAKLNEEQININVLYKAFEEFADIKELYLPRKLSKEIYRKYSQMIDNEFIHMLDNPESRIHEIIDRQKVMQVKNVKLKKFAIEFNFWLKEYNVNIL